MSKRHLFFILLISIALLIATGIPTKPQLFSQNNNPDKVPIAGRNVNMVSGTILPDGDPWLQRQNEPSIAVSTRNPLHLLAGANDYRTVDMPIEGEELPGVSSGIAAGDAWLGVFKSYDGGESWTSSLIPGFPQDSSIEGVNSPLKFKPAEGKGFKTAADPVVRAGTNGLFYYSGIAFNRENRSVGVVFVARFIDNNDKEGGDTIQYLDTKIIDGGNAGHFLDMPRIAVDIPRGSNCGNVYIAYSDFLGNLDQNIRSRILFARSTDCGATWSKPINLGESQHIIQGATIAIDPSDINGGTVYVAWRRFVHTSQTNAIVIVKSVDGGQTFTKPIVITSFDSQSPFDQPATPDEFLYPDPKDIIPGTSFRTNSYPTIAVDDNNKVYVAWSRRGLGPAGESRIEIATSGDGISWSSCSPIDNLSNFQGHQFMPQLTFAAGKLTMVWYDQRDDYCGQTYGFGEWISDYLPYRHTIDVWAAQADTRDYPNLIWKSTQVSRYLFSLEEDPDNSGTYKAFQAQFNPPNYPLFKSGTIPFHGDYIDITPSPMFVLDKNGKWHFNTEPSDNPLFHVSWTDNRDVRPPSDGDWVSYAPANSSQDPEYISDGRSQCVGGQQPGMRNQNIYTSRITTGIEAGSPTNAKALDLNVPRAFVVFVKNNSEILRSFRLTIANQPTAGHASFLQFDFLDTLDVSIAPYSTISRQVFVDSTDLHASVTVNIDEIDKPGGSILPDGIKSSVILNGDPTSPGIVGGEETHQPEIDNPNIVNWFVNPNIVNPNIVNPNIVNPNIVNPNIVNLSAPNPNIVNPNIVNPNIVNPNIVNPNIVNPNIVNPNIVNPNIVNASPEEISITDVEWPVRNAGNTTSSFTFKLIAKESLPEGIYAQLIIYKVHYTPAVAGEELKNNMNIDDCVLKLEPHHEVLLNVVNPNIVNPNIVNPNIVNPNIVNAAIENATFVLGPEEEAIVNLRIIDTSKVTASGGGLRYQGKLKTQQIGLPFDIQSFVESVGAAVTSQSADSEDAEQGIEEPPSAATIVIISTSSLPPGTIGMFYPKAPYTQEDARLKATGGTEPYSWWVNPSDLPPGLSLDTSSGQIYGSPIKELGKTYPYTYHFTVQVTDSSSPQQSDNQSLSITIEDPTAPPPPLTITTTSPLPPGTQGKLYGKTLEATGGVWPYIWTLVSSSLPPGLNLDSGGFISGTPAAEGAFSFRVRVTDSGSPALTAEKDFSLTIQAATAPTYKISGTVTIGSSGTPLPGVLMRGLPAAPSTNSAGVYSDTLPEGWSGTVTPFKAGYDFVPSERTYTNVTSDQLNQNYTVNPVELDHFELSTIDGQPIGNQVAGLAFSISITAKDSTGKTVTTYTDLNTLGDTTGTISPTSTGPFINGVWTGQVTIMKAALGVKIRTSGGGKTGESNAFNVAVGVASSIKIESEADGIGTEVNDMTIGPEYSFTVYAIARDVGNNFVDNVPVTWSLIDKSGVEDADLVPAADNKSATFTGHGLGTARILAHHDSLGDDTTGTITVAETVPDDIYEENDDFAQAKEITLGTTYTNLVLRDQDWFKVYVSAGAGKDLKVHLKGTSFPSPNVRRDLDFMILNSSGKMLSYNPSGGADETAYITDVSEGWYYVGHTYIEAVGIIYSMTVEVGDNFGLGYIEGRVTDEQEKGIEGVYVELYGVLFNWDICRPLITTDSNGYYKIGFIPGNYTVRFNLQSLRPEPLAPEVNYIGKTYNSNEIVTIAAGATVTGIDAKLSPGGAITGRVIGPDGNGLSLAGVEVYASDATRVSFAWTDPNGYYTADRMRPGNYKVRFRAPGSVNYGIEWYDNAYSFEDGLPVPVQVGSTTSGINAQLEEGGYIEGRVTDSSGYPIQGVSVSAYDVAGISLATVSGGTGPDGYYRLRRLPAGDVKIFFNASGTAGNYASEYYMDKYLIGEAVPVSVQAGQTTYGIDAQLVDGGTITGRVTDSQGYAYPGIAVICFDIDSDRYYSVTTNLSGNYILGGLLPDGYKVRFRPGAGNYAVEWYNDKGSFADGDEILVNAGETVPDIDAEIVDNGGFISGRVTNGTTGIEGVNVWVRDSIKQGVISSSITAADGSYIVPRIPECQAKVYFNADSYYLNYVSEYYNDKSDHADADLVSVFFEQTTPEINAVLAPIPALAITTASLPDGEVGVPYSNSLQASGGRTFYYWSVISGSLPLGLTLNGKGIISGKPTVEGTFNFTAQVTDSTNPQQTASQSFTITIQAYPGAGYLISGTVIFNGSPLQGVVMNGFPGNPATNDSGEYLATVPADWSGTVTPTLTGYCFNPVNRTYTNVVSPYQNQDYSASVGYDISGIVNLSGSPLQGVLMSGLPGSPRTNASGFYTAAVPSGWSGTVTPSLPGFTFTPGNRSYTSVTSHQTGQDYTANFPGGQDDAYEPNNDFDQAATITPGTYSDLVLNDEEWFKIYVSAADAGKVLKVHLKGISYPNPTQGKDLDLIVVNGARKLLSYNYSSSDDEIIYITDLTEGWYFIGQTYIGQPGTVYSMTVEVGDNFGIGFISGQVTDDLGNGIENIQIELFRDPNDWNISFPMITSGPDGYYKIGYTPGSYVVRFNLQNFYHRDPWAPDVNYVGKQYPGIFTIVSGTTVSEINVKLVPGGTITGRMMDPDGNGLYNAYVYIYSSDLTRVSLAYTDQNGNYTADRMRTGNYKVFFRGPSAYYSYKWYENTYSFEDGLPVSVQSGSITPNINAQLGRWEDVEGFIEGGVLDSSGSPIRGVSVRAYDVTGVYLYSSATTNENGIYRIRRLAPGDVKIFFYASSASGNYVSEYYQDKFLLQEATPVTVQTGQTVSSINAELAAGGTITGQVIDAQENAYPGITVTCLDLETDRYYSAATDANGNYTLKNLLPDDYKVFFRPGAGNYAVEWYNDKSSFAEGGIVSVGAGQTVSGINAQLAENAGFISGRVTDISDTGIENVRIWVRDSTKQAQQAVISSSVTAADGTYTVPRIPSCQAKVYFNTDLNYLNYASEYYSGQSSFENADLVTGTLGETTPEINAVLAARPGLTITTESLPAGETAVPYSASLQASGGREFYFWSVISGALPNGLALNGKGMISGTPTLEGTFSFTVQVIDSTFPQQESIPKDYSITISPYSGTDYLISGTVTLDGSPLPGVAMKGFPGNPITDISGNYLVAVSPGWSGTVVPTLIGYFFDPANRIYTSVTSNQTNQNYTAMLNIMISGRVTNASGAGIPNVYARVYNLSNNLIVSSMTVSSGNYTVSGLLPGNYKVYFDTSSAGNYISMWYNGKTTFADADQVPVIWGQTTADINAQLAAGGIISGKVSNTSGSGILNVQVRIYDLDNNQIRSAWTNNIGNYSIQGLSSGNYKVYFEGYYAGNYNSEWYNDKVSFATADTVSVTAGATTSINAQLATAGIISGQVTNAQGGGIQYVYVEVMDLNNNWIRTVQTNATGNYSIQGLGAGNYKVYFDTRNAGNYISEWYNDKASFATADPVSVTVGQTTNINAELASGGIISGQATNTLGVGIQYVDVQVRDLNNNWIRSTQTNATGNYSVQGLATGSYKVYFNTYSAGYYVSEWYNDKASFETANPVSVTVGETTSGINAELASGGIISGQVTNTSGAGIQYVNVQVRDMDDNWIQSVMTNAAGNYSVQGLAAGNYKVYFDTYSAGNYISEWYNDKASFATADSVSVTAGATTLDINAQLDAGGIISGKVTNTEGGGIQKVDVQVRDMNNNWIRSALTNTTGDYSVQGLATGSYKVYFDTYSAGYYASEWYNDKASFEIADSVSVTVGQTTNINAELASGGIISGQVTDTEGGGIQYVDVQVRDMNNNWIRSAQTDPAGNYSIQGLAAGNYKVYFDTRDAGNNISEWHNDKSSFVTADSVLVTAGATLSINAQLAAGGTISGQVTNTSNQGIPNVYVNVNDLAGYFIRSSRTDANGNYSVQGLASGNYTVYFETSSAGYYASEWYNDKATFMEANLVSVTVDQTTMDINAQLASGGIISGQATNTLGVGIQYVDVQVRDLDNNWIRSIQTNAAGNYSVQGLAPGYYKVYFDTWNAGNFIPEWYNDKESFETANQVSVTAGATSSINAQLDSGAIISGQVTNASGEGIPNVYVNINDLASYFIRSSRTDSNGNYSVQGLADGNYKVYFDTYSAGYYVSEWYNDKASFDTANPVSVTVGETTSGINAQLASGGIISGQVTDTEGGVIQYVDVQVRDLDNNWIRSIQTNAAGNYSVQGLAPGYYKVHFETWNAGNYISEWYNDKESFETADPVSVTAGATLSINAELAAGGIISGRVTDILGVGIQYVDVQVRDMSNIWIQSAQTDGNGNYEVQGLPSGNYKVLFNGFPAGNYISEWYNDKESFETADEVSVTAGETTQDIDATLSATEAISGQVTNVLSAGIQNDQVYIYASMSNKKIVKSITANNVGNFSITGLPMEN